jgi:diadenosine tetraphosphate (Ap4A) HIT family hydrolase/5-methylcytosine-specific restriction endonuclease McrA
MTYEQLLDFIDNRMRMSHVYQPVMLKILLESQGQCAVDDIAKAILLLDDTQVDYYGKITNNMVGRVLRNHEIVHKVGSSYSLIGYSAITHQQAAQLIERCQNKIDEYTRKRGDFLWQHRKLSTGYISGTIRYEVLKRAGTRCELCGVSNDIKAIEVDHILPRNKGGSDELNNLQALCYSCNAMKRDRDDTDFIQIRESYGDREMGCLFCEMPSGRIVIDNELAYAIRDGFPVTNLHTLIIPKRHVKDYFGLRAPEINACNQLLKILKDDIEKSDKTVTGFNIGINNGETAGQTIFHCHIHLIPRRAGDVKSPRGGVRHTIPGKGSY